MSTVKSVVLVQALIIITLSLSAAENLADKSLLSGFLVGFGQDCSVEVENSFYEELESVRDNKELLEFVTKLSADGTGPVICNRAEGLVCNKFYDLKYPITKHSVSVQRCVCTVPTYPYEPPAGSPACLLKANSPCTVGDFKVKTKIKTFFTNLNKNFVCGFGTFCNKDGRCQCKTGKGNCSVTLEDEINLINFLNSTDTKEWAENTLLGHLDCCYSAEGNLNRLGKRSQGVDLELLISAMSADYKGGSPTKYCNILKNFECARADRLCHCSKNFVYNGEECVGAPGKMCTAPFYYKGNSYPVYTDCEAGHQCVPAVDGYHKVCCNQTLEWLKMRARNIIGVRVKYPRCKLWGRSWISGQSNSVYSTK